MSKEQNLVWVMVGTQLHHVRDFADLTSRLRPQADCPVCGQPVTLKLRQERLHHAAYRPDSTCVLTQQRPLCI